MYLIGDVGNSETKVCLINSKSKIIKRKIIKTNLINKSYLLKNLKFIVKRKKNIKNILFSSVSPKAYMLIKNFINKNTKTRCKEIKQIDMKNFLKIKVNKKQIGSDRLANAISVINKKSNFIILDFGTATTFDVVIKDQYLGGVISPGVNLSLSTLIDRASLIHKINLKKISNVIGKNTNSALRSGFYWGYIGLINNIIDLIKKSTSKKFKIILTGGLSHLFKNSLKTKCKIDKNITIKGLLKVAKKIN